MQAQALVSMTATPQEEKKPMIKEVSGTLDRIKALGAKKHKAANKAEVLKKFQEKKKQAIAEGKPIPSLLDKDMKEEMGAEITSVLESESVRNDRL